MKFDNGDEAVLSIKDDTRNVRERLCCIVSITPTESDEQARHFGQRVGDVLYTVEFGDGTDKLVSETDLVSQSSGRTD